jgi:hypothetical protein
VDASPYALDSAHVSGLTHGHRDSAGDTTQIFVNVTGTATMEFDIRLKRGP